VQFIDGFGKLVFQKKGRRRSQPCLLFGRRGDVAQRHQLSRENGDDARVAQKARRDRGKARDALDAPRLRQAASFEGAPADTVAGRLSQFKNDEIGQDPPPNTRE
jgi:hypothetical protein